MLETLPRRQTGINVIERPEVVRYERTLSFMLPREFEHAPRAFSIHILSENESKLIAESNLINPYSLSFWPRQINSSNDPLISSILSLPRFIA